VGRSVGGEGLATATASTQHGRQKAQCKSCGTGRCENGRRGSRCRGCGTGYSQHGHQKGWSGRDLLDLAANGHNGRRAGFTRGPLRARAPEVPART
jgi:hypothetical protein